jgi:hypothetical protein
MENTTMAYFNGLSQHLSGETTNQPTNQKAKGGPLRKRKTSSLARLNHRKRKKKINCQNGQSLRQDLNLRPPKQKTEVYLFILFVVYFIVFSK